jgi:hypothetical protein
MKSAFDRALLIAVWKQSGSMEHGSVVAFTRLTESVIALGAPAHLVEACLRAALDEVEHARRCFSVVTALAGKPRSPSAFEGLLQVAPRSIASVDQAVQRLVRGSMLDGALGEGVAAEVAIAAARSCRVPEIRCLLEQIAADERRHAELAWEILAFLLDRYPSASATALASIDADLASMTSPSVIAFLAVEAPDLGLLPLAEIHAIAARVRQNVRQRMRVDRSSVSSRSAIF